MYLEVNKELYGLKQAGLLAQQLLEKQSKEHGYSHSKFVPGLQTHEQRQLTFTLVVDDFGAKYVGKEHAEHVTSIFQQYHEITEDWSRSKYIKLTIDWDYENKEVHISKAGYVEQALKRFQCSIPKKHQYSLHPHTPSKYRAKEQFASDDDVLQPLSKEVQKFVQQVVGKFYIMQEQLIQ